MAHTAEIELKVPFFDVDSMCIAWHGHYAKYFEVARCELLDRIGHNYSDMFDSGYSWPIVDMHIRYMRPLRFDQTVRVSATLKRWDHQLRITYQVRDRDSSSLLARGHTLQAPVEMTSGNMAYEQPQAVTEALRRASLDSDGSNA